ETLPDLSLQYKDFAAWQQSHEQQQAIAKQKKFWMEQFADEVPSLELPTDFVRPMIKGHEGCSINFDISAEETRMLKSLTEREGSTMFMVLLSVYNILLSKLSNQEDIVIGT